MMNDMRLAPILLLALAACAGEAADQPVPPAPGSITAGFPPGAA
jgi:hypothetical protein